MENKKKTIGETITWKDREYIPGIFFRMMAFTMKLTDLFSDYSNKHFSTLELKKDQIVVDYGCGPARYIKNASEAVGPKGRVFAVDIHPLAIEDVNKRVKKLGLKNVEAILADGYCCSIPDNTADVVYALDMFHMIEQPIELLKELARIVKPGGIVIIEDGHQPRNETLAKIKSASLFTIYRLNKYHVVCKPI